MEQSTILEVSDCAVVLDSQTLLSDISFTVRKGEALAVIGPNGAGKTLLFKALLGLVPFSGRIVWQAGLRIGYVPQKFPVDKTVPLTVREFFLLKAKRFWFPDETFLKHLSHELSLVGLSQEVLERPVGELSGGQLQRLLIAWAMLDHPEVMLFDEPTAGIDIGFEETVYHLLQRLQKERGTTILLISHELSIVYRYADQVLCVNRVMLCHGKPHEVLHPQDLTRLFGEGAYYEHREQAHHQ
ncbi:MAG: metal ABC transporter ATP-binding protein [Candidatus Binatia bacterium]